jgi:hypothetical protein
MERICSKESNGCTTLRSHLDVELISSFSWWVKLMFVLYIFEVRVGLWRLLADKNTRVVVFACTWHGGCQWERG